MKAMLHKNNLPGPAKPFPVSLSTTSRDVTARKKIAMLTTGSYEASNAIALQIGPINGDANALSPSHIPLRAADPYKIELGCVVVEKRPDHSFQALVDRSIKVLTRGGTPATRQAVEKHAVLLKGLRCLEDLLTAKEAPFWFFQRHEFLMHQKRLRKWDPEALGHYVLLPIGGEFANSEDCIFVCIRLCVLSRLKLRTIGRIRDRKTS